MKLGFYLFAEYINMFISSVIMATLFFGGYDIPFLDESTLCIQIWLAIAGSVGTDDKSRLFYFPIHVGTLDDSAIPLRSVDASWLENIDPTCIVQYAGNRGSDIYILA